MKLRNTWVPRPVAATLLAGLLYCLPTSKQQAQMPSNGYFAGGDLGGSHPGGGNIQLRRCNE